MPKHIMVVDDEEDVLELVKEILNVKGYKVTCFDDAKKAFDKLKKNVYIDLLLLDLRMPSISGPEFAEKLRNEEKLKKIKVAYFSATPDVNTELIKEDNVVGFIQKTFEINELIKEIKKMSK